MDTQSIPYVEAPTRLSYDIFKVKHPADMRMAAVLVMFNLVCWARFGFAFILLSGSLSLWLWWPLMWSRRYYAMGEFIYDLWIRLYLRDVIFEDWTKSTERDTPLSKPRRNILAFRQPMPIRVDTLHDIGLMYNTATGTDSVGISSPGSDIAGMSLAQMHEMQEIIASAIRRVASYSGTSVELSFVYRRRPYDKAEIELSFDENAYPDIAVPVAAEVAYRTGLTLDEQYQRGLLSVEDMRRARLAQILQESTAEAINNGCDVDMVAILTMRRPALLHSAAKGKTAVSAKAAQNTAIVDMAKDICAALAKASVRNPHIMTPEECEDYLRASWDIAGLPTYHVEQAVLRSSDNPEASQYHPQYGMYTSDASCVADQTGHVTVCLTNLPATIVPNLMPLLFADSGVRWPSVAIIGEPTSGKAEYFRLGWFSSAFDNLIEAVWLRTGPKTRNRRAAMEDRQEELASGHTEYFRVFLSAANDDPEELDGDIARLLGVAKSVGGAAKIVRGRSRQFPAMFTATTGIGLI